MSYTAQGRIHYLATNTLKAHTQTSSRLFIFSLCLISLLKDPMFLDLIGTCHSELQKPAILKPEHLVLYKLSWSRRMDTPDSHHAAEQDHDAQLDQQGVLCPLEEVERQRQMKVVKICIKYTVEF